MGLQEIWDSIAMSAFDALTYASYMAYIERHSSQFTSFLTSYSIIAFYHLIFSFSSVCHFPCHLLPLLLFFFFFCLPLSLSSSMIAFFIFLSSLLLSDYTHVHYWVFKISSFWTSFITIITFVGSIF